MDDDDKIRRNLIVTSAIVIGAAWFDISLPDLLERLFSIKSAPGAQAAQLSDWKVWVAALTALGYMSWRYRWSDEVEKALKQLSESIEARYAFLVRTDYLPLVASWLRIGKVPADAHKELLPILDRVNEIEEMKKGRPDHVSLKPGPAIGIDSGNLSASFVAFWGSENDVTYSTSFEINVYIDVKRYRNMVHRAKRFCYVNSKASMSLFWPITIAGSAVLIAAYKLARAVFA